MVEDLGLLELRRRWRKKMRHSKIQMALATGAVRAIPGECTESDLRPKKEARIMIWASLKELPIIF